MILRLSLLFPVAIFASAADSVSPARKSQTETCAPCHPAQAKGHAATLMAHTLEPGDRSRIIAANPELKYKLGAFEYRVYRDGAANSYSVTDGRETIKAPIQWIVGQGEAGQTYLLERDGKLYESRVSYYNEVGGLEVTIGAPPGLPKNIEEAFGREMRPSHVVECFTCHSAPRPGMENITRGTIEWTHALDVGVQCENCHNGAWKHAAARASGDMKSARLTRLKQATTEELSDICGVCHRTWAFIQLNGPHGIGNVRFQPYRIVKSRCYDAVDRRIGCTACHDPHSRPENEVKSYDSACGACHQADTKATNPMKQCKVGTSDCASCHMPQYEIPGSHFKFTDHYIRIVKSNETYPD